MISRERLSGGGSADLGTIPEDVETLQTDLAALDSSVDAVAERVNALDGLSEIGNVGASQSMTAGSGNGTVKRITLTAANCNITFNTSASGVRKQLELEVTQDATGGRLITWVSNVVWPGGTEPTLSTAPGAVDRFVFVTYTNGTTWYGQTVGLAYS